jgi:hypothetical protein
MRQHQSAAHTPIQFLGWTERSVGPGHPHGTLAFIFSIRNQLFLVRDQNAGTEEKLLEYFWSYVGIH